MAVGKKRERSILCYAILCLLAVSAVGDEDDLWSTLYGKDMTNVSYFITRRMN